MSERRSSWVERPWRLGEDEEGWRQFVEEQQTAVTCKVARPAESRGMMKTCKVQSDANDRAWCLNEEMENGGQVLVKALATQSYAALACDDAESDLNRVRQMVHVSVTESFTSLVSWVTETGSCAET